MSTINDGGPAYPVPPDHVVEMQNGRGFASNWGMGPQNGMSLRAHIATLALQRLVGQWDDHAEAAKDAVAYADALIAELQKVPA